MSTLIVAAILTGMIAAACLLLVALDNRQKQKALSKHLQQFSKEGARNNLAFSSQEVLSNCLIGLDGLRRKLLLLKIKDERSYSSVVIDLAAVKRCSVKKQFLVPATDFRSKKSGPYLEKIVLHFAFDETRPPVEAPFFDHVAHPAARAPELETKAKHWEVLLSKMLSHPRGQRA